MADEQQQTVFDTGQQYLGGVYAKALLGASENAGVTDAVLEELEAVVADVLNQLPNVEQTLSSPRVPLEAKEQMLEQAFGGKMTVELLRFLKVVARRGRFDCLRAIAKAAREQFNEMRGRVAVQVRAAEPLDQAAYDQVSSQLQASLGKEVDLQVDVDPDLIGGLVFRIGDTVYDGSVANRLARLRGDVLSRASQQMRGNVDRFALAE